MVTVRVTLDDAIARETNACGRRHSRDGASRATSRIRLRPLLRVIRHSSKDEGGRRKEKPRSAAEDEGDARARGEEMTEARRRAANASRALSDSANANGRIYIHNHWAMHALAVALGVTCAVAVFYGGARARGAAFGRARRTCDAGGKNERAMTWPFVDDGAGMYAYATSSNAHSEWGLQEFAAYMATTSKAPRVGRGDRRGTTPAAKSKRVVGTHHKTGTALMHDVFQTIALNSSFSFFDARAAEDSPMMENEAYFEIFNRADIVVDYHIGKPLPKYLSNQWKTRACESMVSLIERDGRDYKLVHVVRDPVDVIVSGAVYHSRRVRDEKWLNVPIPELKGLTYAEFLKTSTPEQALLAEISFADDELRMLVLTYAECEVDDRCLNVRFESFSKNFSKTLSKVLRHLDFAPRDVAYMVEICEQHDTNTWSADELESNEHYTKRENRSSYYAAVRSNAFLRDTLKDLQRAMHYS